MQRGGGASSVLEAPPRLFLSPLLLVSWARDHMAPISAWSSRTVIPCVCVQISLLI